MIEYVTGNLFESGCEALVNPVNCRGTMGAGLALQFRNRYPNMCAEYVKHCRRGLLQPGQVLPIDIGLDGPKWILNVATKDDSRDPSKLEWIGAGLGHLRKFIVAAKIKSVAVPSLGCGYGKLGWDAVKALMDMKLDGLDDVLVKVYSPYKLERGPMID